MSAPGRAKVWTRPRKVEYSVAVIDKRIEHGVHLFAIVILSGLISFREVNLVREHAIGATTMDRAR